MTQSHYSLRWNNHQSHILSAFDALLQAETLVDVTLVCAETSVRAHKVVLSACSPFFQRIFSENPCKHPVIVLKDFHGWEVQAIVDFMYKGEISVGQEQLQNLIKAAESLQVRGLAQQDQLSNEKDMSSPLNPTPSPPSLSPDFERMSSYCPSSRYPTPGMTARTTIGGERISSPPFSPGSVNYEPPLKLPHMMHPLFAENLIPPPPPMSSRHECTSPLPRRKQARPRRRSGEMCIAQDLTKPPSPIPPPPRPPQPHIEEDEEEEDEEEEETAENLCIKKSGKEREPQEAHQQPPPVPPPLPLPLPPPHSTTPQHQQPQPQQEAHQQQIHLPPQPPPPFPPPLSTQLQLHLLQQQHHPLKLESFELGSPSELDLSLPDKEYAISPPLSLPPMLGMLSEQQMDSHSPLPFPPLPSVSGLTMTPPHIFGLDSPLSLFPPGLDGCRNPLLDLVEPRMTCDPPPFTKKKRKKCNVQVGRPKGQHSAPRGGPPRSWTNAELTEALQHVWNKKMTTSQASRIFGIPYNSLLMYVRGKYGKSLKLEQLRKDCIGGPGGPLDLLGLGASHNNNNNNNNNKSKSDRDRDRDRDQDLLNTRPPSSDELPPPLFNPFAPNFYPDFGPGFPIPVSMIHLLPQSEKNRELCIPPPGPPFVGLDDDCKSEQRFRELLEQNHPELFAPLPAATSQHHHHNRDERERRELVQQNGQD